MSLSRSKRYIIKLYKEKKVLPHENIVKVIGSELGYVMDENGSYPFVRKTIAEYKRIGQQA